MKENDEYREIYHKLQGYMPEGMYAHGIPTNTDDLLREEGVNVKGSDVIPVSQSALFVLLARRVRKLEEAVSALTEGEKP